MTSRASFAGSRAEHHYDLRGTDALPTDGPDPVVNMGLWRARPATLHAANLALFDRVIELAEIRGGTRVLDVGCGFGTAAMRVAERTDAAQIVGINVSTVQLRTAYELTRARGLEQRVAFVAASATALPFADASVDHLVSIEAAFHFDTRDAFFREAHRVLRPGGTLALADLVITPPRNRVQEAMLVQLSRALAFPLGNAYGLPEYAARVARAGLVVEHAESIAHDVVPAFRRWMLRHSWRHRALAADLAAWPYLVYPWDYALVRAVRP
ncbi:SAM-dependent methyltransferase [Sandaracinus amylolyticus]|uniref:Gamma-tocopherol methyltransferase n=1 Tax=Sandaracinus amylolyticus TaxID=927083 RepID=A0A0F6W9I8_9BACT|nr:class I SAM-dependent methyltransferase [Sandaracinus amylolyticus]AKF10808.1 gamma-tocopherol methyltransferase [Sandaracinus amylolyticus]